MEGVGLAFAVLSVADLLIVNDLCGTDGLSLH